MSRLVSFLSNDPQRLACILQPYRDQLLVTAHASHDGWGLGYFQHGQLLFKKRPKGQGMEEIRVADLLAGLRSDALIFHLREATVGAWTSENTHPFRYRSWMFAHRGTLAGFSAYKAQLTEKIPQFLRRNLRGETDSEFAFHLFLARLVELGRVDDRNVDPRLIAGVLASTINQLDAFAREAGVATPSPGSFAVMNGRILVATRRGFPLHYLRREGIDDCRLCGAQQDVGGSRPRVAHKLLRFVIVATDLTSPPSHWVEVPDSSVLTVGPELAVTVAPLAL